MQPDARLLEKFAEAGIKTTRQRLIIGRWLWRGDENRHVDAGDLHAEIEASGERVSLATVYNALRDFECAGLIRRVAVSSDRIWYDTDTANHLHFHIRDENRLLDVPGCCGQMTSLPDAPAGYRIARVDTVFHLEKVD